MKISEFNYNLPNELIATHPVESRDSARMLVMDCASGALTDKHFTDLPEILRPGDVLVFNDSKVIPARLFGRIGEREFEILLVKNLEDSTWECWVKPGKKAKAGDIFQFSDKLSAEFIRRDDDIFILKFNLAGSAFFSELGKIGEMPVPPYILKARHEKHDEVVDKDDYQTVYARAEGSVAAPTAGLHFTDELLERLRERGVHLEYVTLHVGLGTFQPVTAENIEDFQIHSEYYEISPETALRLNDAKREGRRVIAVGTTTVRVLESVSRHCEEQSDAAISATAGDTNIFIYPGYTWRFVDGMITNFHMPQSSLLLLVSAFAGTNNIRNAYDYAVENKYRFYSYGDGMVII